MQQGAAGTFIFGFADGKNFVSTQFPPPNTTPLRGVPLTIQVNGQCPIRIVSTDPPPCTIDARFPNDPANVATRYGFDTITLTFSRDPGPLTLADFEPSPLLPGICGIDQNGAVVKVTICRPIPSATWTCVRYLGDPSDVACIGALGADTDANRLSDTPDTLALIDALEGNHTLLIWQSDLDRSGVFTPIDILASIDLLNGAGALNLFKGSSLSACPTIGIPIP
ncbi:MAG: hypothetical protein HY287_17445 [Planctomycetes bacterium]|nr:hypothetical protein [Planctomycetota bacterium]MBI3836112.1 hypothetical protein [Planctomycetota bacterium]